VPIEEEEEEADELSASEERLCAKELEKHSFNHRYAFL
jgi:hypothetical protein